MPLRTMRLSRTQPRRGITSTNVLSTRDGFKVFNIATGARLTPSRRHMVNLKPIRNTTMRLIVDDAMHSGVPVVTRSNAAIAATIRAALPDKAGTDAHAPTENLLYSAHHTRPNACKR